MSAIFRTPAVIDVSLGVANPLVTKAAAPIRVERFTAKQVQDPDALALQLTRIHQLAADATQESRSSPLRAPTVYKGLTVGVGGAITVIRHGLGRRAFWWIVGWSGLTTTTAPRLVSDESDGAAAVTDVNTLALRSYVAGIVDLAVA